MQNAIACLIILLNPLIPIPVRNKAKTEYAQTLFLFLNAKNKNKICIKASTEKNTGVD